MRSVALPDGERVPVLGQGTWRMGESKNARAKEVAALRLGIELGMRVGHSGALLRNAALKKIAKAHDATSAQIALAWVLRQPEAIAIPKEAIKSMSAKTPDQSRSN